MDSTTSQEEINQRRYISLACKNCRDKHRRCDGKDPCNRCTAINVKCEYMSGKPRGGYRRKDPTKKASPTQTIQAQTVEPTMPLPNQELNIYIDYYASIHAKNSPSYDKYRIPSSLANLSPEQKFRVSATLAMTALTLGHLTQGHMLLDQAKNIVPQMMSNSSADALHGFGALAQCHAMEFDYLSSSNYTKIAKNIANLLWKLQRSTKMNNGMDDRTYLSLMEGFIGGKLFYLEHLPDRSSRTLKKAVRALEDLADLILEINAESLQVLSFIKGMYNIGLCHDLENVFESINTVEKLAMKFSSAMKDPANIIVYYVNVLRYALLNDVVEMRAACHNLIKMYDEMLNYTTLSLALLSSTTLMWYALGLNSELNQLLSIAHRMSMFFPGCKIIVERFTQGNLSEVSKWNPFTGIREKVQSFVLQRQSHDQDQQAYNSVVIQTDYTHLEPLSSYSSSDSPSDQGQQISQEYNEHNSTDLLNQAADMSYLQQDYLFDPLY